MVARSPLILLVLAKIAVVAAVAVVVVVVVVVAVMVAVVVVVMAVAVVTVVATKLNLSYKTPGHRLMGPGVLCFSCRVEGFRPRENGVLLLLMWNEVIPNDFGNSFRRVFNEIVNRFLNSLPHPRIIASFAMRQNYQY